MIARVGMIPMEPASLIMERTLLFGIKARAEHLARAAAAEAPRAPVTVIW